jgi:hypothetical protein
MNTLDCFKAVKPFDIKRYKDFIKQPHDLDTITLPSLSREILLRGVICSIPEELFLTNHGIITPIKLRDFRIAFNEIDRAPLTSWLSESMRSKPSIIQGIATSRGLLI